MGAYDFVVNLHLRGGAVVNQYICTGGTYIEYTEPNETEVKTIFLNQA